MRTLRKTHVCTVCGAAFEIPRWLEAHWYALGHSPEHVQAAALTRAREGSTDNRFPERT
jgi:hypothetical protein